MTRDDAAIEIEELSQLLRQYNYEYYISNDTTVSDLEYDRLFDKLKTLEAEFPELVSPDSPSRRIGSDLRSDLPEAQHSIPVLSLDKAYSEEAILSWIDKTAANAGQELTYIVEEKIDGVSIVLYYQDGRLVRAITRGNGYVGNDVTANVMTIRSVPLRLSREVTLAARGEIYLPVAKFEKLNEKLETAYANPRNLAAGSIRRIRSAEVAEIPLEIYVYDAYLDGAGSHMENLETLAELKFRINPRVGLFSKDGSAKSSAIPDVSTGVFDDIKSYIQREVTERPNLPYEIDGLVLKVNELPVREVLGSTGHHPRWAIAYKFEAPESNTKVSAVDVQVGRTGRITPVARVEPVKIGGSVVSNVTLHNQDYIDLLELSVGDRVSVSKRGDVIPAVERVLEKNEDATPVWRMPETCPSCKHPLVVRGAHHFCENDMCPDQNKGRLYFFVGKGQMDIDNLGPETIDVLLQNGLVEKVEDIYTCDYDQLAGITGFGDKKIALIKAGVESSKSRPFSAALPALGVPELGPKVTELLIEAGYADIDSILEMSDGDKIESLEAIPGIGEKIAATVVTELKKKGYRKSIEALRRAGLNFRQEPASSKVENAEFEGQSWCVTGSFDRFKPRDLAMDEVKKRGGKCVAQVSGSTTHLLAGAGAGSKLAKAKSLGVTIVTEEEFLRTIEDGE